MDIAFSIFYWCYLGTTSFVLFLGAILLRTLTSPFDSTCALLHRYTCWWGTLYLRCLPGCRIHVEGKEKLHPGVAYVLVANHQSMTDIMALSTLAFPFKWVSKKEAFRIPFIGWNMILNRYVSIDRGNLRKVRRTMKFCEYWLRQGVPILMFPEGHRSKNGEMRVFHNGAFKLAADCACPVVPIVVDGTWGIYQGTRVEAFPGLITIRVLDPVTLEESGGSVDLFCARVHERMKLELKNIRQAGAVRQIA